jgi:hypothetical protein
VSQPAQRAGNRPGQPHPRAFAALAGVLGRRSHAPPRSPRAERRLVVGEAGDPAGASRHCAGGRAESRVRAADERIVGEARVERRDANAVTVRLPEWVPSAKGRLIPDQPLQPGSFAVVVVPLKVIRARV